MWLNDLYLDLTKSSAFCVRVIACVCRNVRYIPKLNKSILRSLGKLYMRLYDHDDSGCVFVSP